MSIPAVGYLGKEYTFLWVKQRTDTLSNALSCYGIETGEVVLVGLPLCPEALVVFLALNKIGAVSRWFDLRCAGTDILSYAQESNCRLIVTIDVVIPKVQGILNNCKVQNVLFCKATESASIIPRIIQGIKNDVKIPNNDTFLSWKAFFEKYKGQDSPCVKYEQNRPKLMIQSSGTTGKPKVIVHTDYSINYMIQKNNYIDFPIGINKTVFLVIPPWVAYGLVDTLLCSLSSGMKVEMFPTMEPDSLYRYIGKYTAAFAVPIHLRYLYEHYNKLSSQKKKALSRVDWIISGGDKISVSENKEWDDTFGVKVFNGYGSSECLGGICLSTFNNNKYGTVGIPKVGNVITVFESDTEQELQCGETGELCVQTDTAFLYYQDNIEETNQIKRKHSNGECWIHTGDLGFVDNDGFIHVLGRLRRVITRAGFKISAYLIEQKICEVDGVIECCVVEADDKVEEHVPFAFVKVDKGCKDKENIKNRIFEELNRSLKTHEIPKYIEIVDELPYTQNRKYDITSLEKLANKLIKDDE